MLTGTSLGDQTGLAHPLGQQRLTQHVVDLVRSRVVQILPFQQQSEAQTGAELVALGEDRGAARVVAQDVGEIGTERGIGPRFAERGFELLARRHQCFGHESAAELAEATRRARAHPSL